MDEQFISLLDGPELADWKSRHLLISGNKTGFYERAVKSGKPMEPATTAKSGSNLTQAELVSFCKDKIGGYKIPKRDPHR